MTVPNVVHAALFLILSLLAVAGFYILLSSEFLALVQVLIYAGAVATIILFGLMLTRGARPARAMVGASGQRPLARVGAALAGCSIAVLDTDWPRDARRGDAACRSTHARRRAVPRLAAALRGRLGRAAGRADRRRGHLAPEEGEA